MFKSSDKMKRLDGEQLKELKNFVKQDFSLNEIKRIMKLKKTTVYYYFRKFKGLTIKQPIIKINNLKILGEILGIFAGDGSLYFEPKKYGYQVRIHFGIQNIEYKNYVKNLFEKCFNKKFTEKLDGKRKIIIETKSKRIFEFFHKFLNFKNQEKALTITVKENTLLKNKKFILGFLKGLLDTDGTICRTDNKLRITFYTSSKNMMKQISNFLNFLGIRHGISEDKRYKNISYHIYIIQKSTIRLINLLNPFWAGRSTVEDYSKQFEATDIASLNNGKGMNSSNYCNEEARGSNPRQSIFQKL